MLSASRGEARREARGRRGVQHREVSGGDAAPGCPGGSSGAPGRGGGLQGRPSREFAQESSPRPQLALSLIQWLLQTCTAFNVISEVWFLTKLTRYIFQFILPIFSYLILHHYQKYLGLGISGSIQLIIFTILSNIL